MSNLADQIIRLGHQLSEERNAAHDLWSWLPSHDVAVKHHGDYASNFQPSVKDVMAEAAQYFAWIKSGRGPLTTEDTSWFNRCPCDEDHGHEGP